MLNYRHEYLINLILKTDEINNIKKIGLITSIKVHVK